MVVLFNKLQEKLRRYKPLKQYKNFTPKILLVFRVYTQHNYPANIDN
jgi:hypothetical protein